MHGIKCDAVLSPLVGINCVINALSRCARSVTDRFLQYANIVGLPPISHAGFNLIFTAVLKRCVQILTVLKRCVQILTDGSRCNDTTKGRTPCKCVDMRMKKRMFMITTDQVLLSAVQQKRR